jgi:hypothetical protein
MKRDTFTLPLGLAPELIIDNFAGLVVMDMTFAPCINGSLGKARKFLFAIAHVDCLNTRQKAIGVVRRLKCVEIVPDLDFCWGNSHRGCHGAPLAQAKRDPSMITEALTEPKRE